MRVEQTFAVGRPPEVAFPEPSSGLEPETPSLPCDFGGNRWQPVGNEIWLVAAVSGLETIEPFAPRCTLVFPQPFHPLPALQRFSGSPQLRGRRRNQRTLG